MASTNDLAMGTMEEPDLVGCAEEVRLFHGTKPNTVLAMLQDGLNERFSNGCFGYGTYFAEDAGKSDQYVTRDEVGSSALLSLHNTLYRDMGTRSPAESR